MMARHIKSYWLQATLVVGLFVAATAVACSGGEGDVIISGPGPGRDEPPFPPVVPGGGTFSGNCAPLVSCESLGATCGTALDNCGEPLECNNFEQDGDETDVDCGGGGTCLELCQSGQMCAENTDCQSDLCTGSVCCDSACDAECMTCDSGFCTTVSQGTEDPDTCTAPMACDGIGACKLATGEICTMDDDCASDFCNGVGGGGNGTCL